jgi:hypothetical protein
VSVPLEWLYVSKIVVALNDLPESQRALRTAIELARVSNAGLATLSILGDLPSLSSFTFVVDPTAPDAMMEDWPRDQGELHQKASLLAQEFGSTLRSTPTRLGRNGVHINGTLHRYPRGVPFEHTWAVRSAWKQHQLFDILCLQHSFASHSTGLTAIGRAAGVLRLQTGQQAYKLAIPDIFLLVATCCVASVVVSFMSKVPTQYRQVTAAPGETK